MKFPNMCGGRVAASARFAFLFPGLLFLLAISISAQTFSNTAPITVLGGPANNGNPYPSAISVTGLPTALPTAPGAVTVTLNNFSHTFPDDLGIVLVGPTGASLLLQNGAGDDPDMSGVTYSLSDTGASQLPDLTAWTAGTYRPTAYYSGDSFPAPGPGTAYGNPGPAGAGTATFASVFGGTNPNGTWNLYVRDFVSGDAGSIAGGWSITFSGFAAPPQNIIDFNGDGRTDFALVRNIGGGPGGQVRWFINYNNTTTTIASDWGLSTDFFVPADYDGDNRTDIAVWRPLSTNQPSGNALFYILQSQTNTVRIVDLGISGDDPSVVGDYDGDNKADPAVYREGASATSQSFWYYRGSLNNPSNNITYVQWGAGGDFPAPGDYDGDGRNDYVVQRGTPSGQARFWLRQTTAGNAFIDYGLNSDLVVPGDYDGDGKTDIAVARGIAGQYNWFFRPSSTGIVTATPFAVFGNTATDFVTPGDYDGDGRNDAAVWRSSPTPSASAFWYRTNTGSVVAVPFGAQGDFPVANTFVF